MSDTPRASEEERLDEETEIRIGAFLEDALVEGRLRNEPDRRVGELDQAIDFRHASANALRQRIRTLIKEARQPTLPYRTPRDKELGAHPYPIDP